MRGTPDVPRARRCAGYCRAVRFMVSRRWALFAVVVVVLAYGCYLLGQWQFHRLHDREATNTQTRANLKADPAPVGDVLAPGGRPPAARRVAPGHRPPAPTSPTVLGDRALPDPRRRLGRRHRDAAAHRRRRRPAGGPRLDADRQLRRRHRRRARRRRPGTVTVVGWVRADATGDAATRRPTGRRARSRAWRSARRSTCRCTAASWTSRRSRRRPPTPLVHAELPDLGNGPHFFYGLQWWFFGVLAVFGFFYLAYDERKKLRAAAAATVRDGSEARASRRRPAASRR